MSSANGFVRADVPVAQGVDVWVRDETACYGYRNIYTVRLRVRISAAGSPVAHERLLERMGVYEEALNVARRELLAGFCNQIAPYLARAEFGEKLARYLRGRLQRAPAVGYS